MEPFKARSKTGPEAIIQRNFIRYLKDRDWGVERMIGNALQKGIPDIYVMHPEHGQRWIDLKNPHDYEFTKAQIIKSCNLIRTGKILAWIQCGIISCKYFEEVSPCFEFDSYMN